MQKLLNLARRIAPTLKNTSSATGVYYLIKGDKFLKSIYSSLEANEIVLLCFLIQGYKDEINLEDMIANFEQHLFSFLILEVATTHPEESCDYCGGDGSTNCRECDGNGNVDCPDCDGDGDDEEGNICSYCDGSGKVDCDECGGDGYESCYDCGGSGSEEAWDEYEFEQVMYVSIDRRLFNLFEGMEELEEFELSKLGPYVIALKSDNGTTSETDFSDIMGDTVFGKLNPQPELVKSMFSGIYDGEIQTWV